MFHNLAIDQSQLLQYVDMGLLIAFIAFFVLLLLAFLRGLLRGWKQGTYRLLVLGTLTLVLLLMMPIWVDVIGGIQLNNWIASPLHVEMQGKSFELEVGTLFVTIRNFIEGFLKYIVEAKMSPAAIQAYAIALAGSIIRLIMVAVIALLVETIGSFLCWLLWHIAFKHIIPKPRRKPSKRVISGLEEAAVYFCLLALTVVPFTGVVNALHNNGELPQDSENETINLINKVVDTYDKSIFNQALFAWTKGSGKDTLDTQIAQFFAANTYKMDEAEFQANIVKEIRVISQVEGSLVEWLVKGNPNESTVGSLFHTSLLVGQTLYSFVENDNALMNGVVPMTFDVARNLDLIKENIISSEESYRLAASEPALLKRAYARVAETEYVSTIEDFFQGDYAVAAYDSSLPYSEAYLPAIEKEMESSAESRNLVNAVISGYVLSQAESNPAWEEEDDAGVSVLQFLPHHNDGTLDEEAVASIDWWREANILHNARKSLSKLMPKSADESSMDSTMQKLLNAFLNAIANDPYGLIEIFVGKRDAKGEPVADGGGNNVGALCLFDSDLISTFAPFGLAIGSNYLKSEILTDPEDEATKTDLDDVLAQFEFKTTSDMRVKLRREFGAILDVAGKTISHPSGAGRELVLDYQNHPGIDFGEDGSLIRIDPDLCLAFTDGVLCLDNSKFFAGATPGVAEHFIRPLLASDQALGQLGIRHVNFRCGNLAAELARILSVGVHCPDLIGTAGSLMGKADNTGTSLTSIIAGFVDHERAANGHQLTHLLDILTGSKVLNPVPESGKPYVRNENIANLLNYLFSAFGEDYAINLQPEDLDLELTSTWDGDTIGVNKDGRYGENYYITTCLTAFIDTKILDNISTLQSQNVNELIRYLSSVDVQGLFSTIGDSSVMRLVSSHMLDKFLLDGLVNSDKSMDLAALGVTYQNLITDQDWKREGVAMQSLLNLAIHGLDLSNLDYTNPSVIEMARKLANSNIFYSPVVDDKGNYEKDESGAVVKEYVFPTFLADKLLYSFQQPELLEFLSDNPFLVPNQFPDTSGVLHPNTENLRAILHDKSYNWASKDSYAQKRIICSVFYEAVTSLTEPEDWLGRYDDLGVLIEKGELDRIQEALRSIQAAGGMELLNNIYIESIPGLALALQETSKSQILGSVLIPNVVEFALTAEQVPSQIRNANINTGYLYRLGEELLVARAFGDKEAYDALIAERDVQVGRVIELVNIALGDEAIRSGDFMKINLGNIDINGFLRPLLEDASNSKIFHPQVGDTYQRIIPSTLYDMDPWEVPDVTAFENLVVAFMQRSAMYFDESGETIDDSNPGIVMGTKMKLEDIVNSVPDWKVETEAVCEIIGLLQNSFFLNQQGDIDLSILSDLEAFFNRKNAEEELNAFFVTINESEIFYRCLPGRLQKTVSDAMKDADIKNISKDINCADFFYTQYDDKSDFAPYDLEEIHCLVDAFSNIGSSLRINPKDLSTVDTQPLCDALMSLGCSKIFNSNTEKAATQFPSQTYRHGMTCLQQMITDLMLVDALDTYYYQAGSPKDAYYTAQGDYNSSETKFVKMVRDNFPVLSSTVSADDFRAAVYPIICEDWKACIDTLKRPVFTDFIAGTSDFNTLDEDSVATLLHALNDCVMYRDCVPNALHKVLVVDNDTMDIEGLDLTKADIYFSYYMQKNHEFSPIWNETPDFDMPFYGPEIDQLAMLIPVLKDNQSKFDDIQLAGDKAIDPYDLRSLLYDIHDSYIFHNAGIAHDTEKTIFRQMMGIFLDKSNIYKESLTAVAPKRIINTDLTLDDLVLAIDESQWPSEIENVFELIRGIQRTDLFVNAKNEFDLSQLSDPETFFSKPKAKEELTLLIDRVNSGQLFYRCLPEQLNKSMSGSFGGTPLLDRIKLDLNCSDYYHTATIRPGDVHDFDPYPDGEVVDMIDLFETMSKFSKIDLSDLSTVDTEQLSHAMSLMGRMEIYNTNTTKSNTVFQLNHVERRGLTAHQAMLCDVILVDKLQTYYYLNESPKDLALALSYTDAETKVAYNVRKLIPVLTYATPEQRSAAQASYEAKAVPLFLEWDKCLDTFKTDFADMIDGSKSMSDIRGDKLKKLLRTMNNCTFYRDIVPNSLYDTLIKKGGLSIDGVDFKQADFFFSYYMQDGSGNFADDTWNLAKPDYDIKFYDPEIDTIADMYDEIQDNKDMLSDLNLKTLDASALNTILDNISESYILNLAYDAHRPGNTSSDYYVINPSAPTVKSFKNLSVFEQFIYKIMQDTTLLKNSYNAMKDYTYAAQFYEIKDETVISYGAEYKMRDQIIALSHASDWSWEQEINALTTDGGSHLGTDADPYVGIIDAAQKTDILGGGSAMDLNFDLFKTISPKKIKAIFYAVNGSRLLKDLLPNSVSDLLGTNDSGDGIGLSRYSTVAHTIPVGIAETTFNSAAYEPFKLKKAYVGGDSLVVPVLSDPTDKFTFTVGDYDLTNFVKMTYDSGAHTATFKIAGLSQPFTLKFNGGLTFAGDLTANVDLAYFDLDQATYKSKAIPSIGLMLSSAYRGDSGYFSFTSGGGSLESFFSDTSDYTHSTYGLLNLFGASGFYDRGLSTAEGDYYNGSDSAPFTAAPFVLYNALNFKIESPIPLVIDLDALGVGTGVVDFGNSQTISIGDRIGKGEVKTDHVQRIQGIFDSMNAQEDVLTEYVREARWFDLFAGHAGTFDLYDSYQKTSLKALDVKGVSINDPEIRSALTPFVDYTFAQSAEAMNSMRSLLNSSRLTYSVTVPNDPDDLWVRAGTDTRSLFGTEVLASIMTEMEQNKADFIDLDITSAVASGVKDYRYSRIGDTLLPVADEAATLRNDYYASDFAAVNPTFLQDPIECLKAMEVVNNGPVLTNDAKKAALKASLEALDAGTAPKFDNLFYLASIYDKLLLNTIFIKNDFLGIHIDYPYFNQANFDTSMPLDTGHAFGYAKIAARLA